MKVCIISSYPPKGSGIAYYTQDLVKELGRISTVDIIKWNYGSRITTFLSPLLNIFKLRKALKTCDIVHIQYVLGEFMLLFLPVLCLLSIGKKAKLIMTTHEDYTNLPFSSFFLLFHNIFYSCFDIIMVHSSSHKAVLSERIQKKTIILPFGTRPDCKKAAIKKSTILLPGFINRWKGHDIAVNAMAIVTKKVKGARLIIAGKPYDKKFAAGIRELIARRKLGSNVEIHDSFIPYNKYREFFYTSEIIILPYRRITMSAVLSDVVGMAKPCICSDLPAFREYTKGKVLFFKPESHDELAERILLLLRDRRLQHDMVKKLRKLAEEYSWKNVARITFKAYSACK